ncbi:hypothetical protein IWX49DRAFT_126278 [Phyllosticta citricarpa]
MTWLRSQGVRRWVILLTPLLIWSPCHCFHFLRTFLSLFLTPITICSFRKNLSKLRLASLVYPMSFVVISVPSPRIPAVA